MADSTQGNGAPEASQGGDAPKYVTEEQLNRAISARLSDFSKKSEKALAEAFGGFEKKLSEMLPKTPDEKGDKGTPTTQSQSIEEHPQFKGLQKQLADLQKKAEESEKAAQAERAKARDTSLRQRLSEELAKGGIKDATRIKHAIRFLVDGERAVQWDEAGESIVFKSEDGVVDFGTGLKAWLKSDDAKLYLPPPEGGASGGIGKPAPTRMTAPSGNGVSFEKLSEDQKLSAAADQLAKLGLGLP